MIASAAARNEEGLQAGGELADCAQVFDGEDVVWLAHQVATVWERCDEC